MSRAQSERVMKNLICEIMEDCVEKGHSLSEALVVFMVSSLNAATVVSEQLL